MRRLHDVGLKTQDQHVAGVDRAGLLHPWPVLGQHLRRQAGEQVQRRQEGGFLLDDAMDGEVADGKAFGHGICLSRIGSARVICREWTESQNWKGCRSPHGPGAR
jgi:hypothetical protein